MFAVLIFYVYVFIGPFMFKLINTKDQTISTTNCFIQLGLMPIRLVALMIITFKHKMLVCQLTINIECNFISNS